MLDRNLKVDDQYKRLILVVKQGLLQIKCFVLYLARGHLVQSYRKFEYSHEFNEVIYYSKLSSGYNFLVIIFVKRRYILYHRE